MHSDLPSVRGILFDLWNTLAWSRYEPNPMVLIAEALGISGRPGWRKILERGMMTRPFLGIREALASAEEASGRRIAPAGAREGLIRRWNEAAAASHLYDDVLPVLESLRPRFRLGLLSNTQSFDVDFIRTTGLDALLDTVCLSCEEGRLKPDPLLFHAATRRLGLAPAGVLMVGDNVDDDVKGALQAGLPALLLDRSGKVPHVPGAARSIRSLTEIASGLS
jgi:HAD superfamily hydrolase (TIGR01509 family)